ncbi:hypothetical protein TBLA_0B09560 [Henningerozyma blattae CBS 6284]|uniref:Translation machinery-associated protein 17 n=1 Tax=Henningerozyma blattae (strain ATCC 34711 / CBS 6284 / DSM 70876 / NBRC 10599 / NRRL Y-10934 / UCD 77-7) TaxID=1071380 RepID=I2H071_HENB6|nr:hypothetical protein TBLA_0B09560 [Tetrapisispora blattae CBS 6284]CCH59773.1 hypothetical protein TBLA_0B09560 [Tetrapisispora blattae CBS 6284]
MSTAGGIRKPVRIEDFQLAIKEMASSELVNIRHEIENSIRHLKGSNTRLEQYIKKLQGQEIIDESMGDERLEELDENDIKLFEESIRENQMVLANYDDRITAIDQEFDRRNAKDVPAPSTENVAKAADTASDNVQQIPNTIYL